MNRLLPLKISKLQFKIDGQQLLRTIDLNISSNGVSVILGYNGAGKSLLLRCMHGLLPPTAGEITWADNSASLLETQKQQAMVFQKPLMLNRSVAANINYVLKLRNRPLALCERLLESANLESKGKQAARSLSGGEQQRLAIARALATDPAVLFLDEPTANLDPQATRKIEAQVINASKESIKIIMVTHDIAQAKRVADEIIFMHECTIAEHTTATIFFKQPKSDAAKHYLSAYIN